jgi:hypothetical protein
MLFTGKFKDGIAPRASILRVGTEKEKDLLLNGDYKH